MSQFGMQMPGGGAAKPSKLNVYTGMLAVAVVALAAAGGFVYVQAVKVAPEGNVLEVHSESDVASGNISLKE